MKIRIELEDNLIENEVVIHCKELNEEVSKIQQAISSITSKNQKFIFFKGDAEYYLSLEEILFFETDGNGIIAHTKMDMFETKQKLYELERMLPGYFLRISKSAICNIDNIYSITKGISSNSVIQFQDTHKQVYVSRRYYKVLKDSMDSIRNR